MSPQLLEYLKYKIALGPCSFEELQNLFLPIFEDLVCIHDQGLVAQELLNNIELKDERFYLKLKEGIPIQHNPEYLLKTFESNYQFESLPNFKSPEIEAKQHDALGDIYQIGLVFSSLALAIPLYEIETIQRFHTDRQFRNKIEKNNILVISHIVSEMTNPARKRRTSDLRNISLLLQFPQEFQYAHKDSSTLLKAFQSSLLDFSKKSNILYTKDLKHLIDLKQLQRTNYTQTEFLDNLTHKTSLEFFFNEENEENKRLWDSFKSLQNKSKQDIKTIGFSNLKLAIHKIHWCSHDSSENAFHESHLFFLPVQLSFLPGKVIRLELFSTELEVNPTLRYYLFHNFNIQLPESARLSTIKDDKTLDFLFKASAKSNLPIDWVSLNDNNTIYDSFTWSLDKTHVVLGNFNYKKVSLVKDYERIIKQELQSTIAQEILQSKATEDLEPLNKIAYTPEALYNITSTDPYQDQAILSAQQACNFVIQGPPGTGKSQTITNIIANFVAKDKKVLFVSGKRAALDTVFHKLKSSGLDNISTIIYDAQTDKKDFIQAIKNEYTSRSEKVLNLESITSKRNQLASEIKMQNEQLSSYQNTLNQLLPDCITSRPKDLYRININSTIKTEKTLESLQRFSLWEKHQKSYRKLHKIFQEKNIQEAFCNQAFAQLSKNTWKALSLGKTIEKDSKDLLLIGQICFRNISNFSFINSRTASLESLDKVYLDLSVILDFSSNYSATLLDKNSNEYLSLKSALESEEKLNQHLALIENHNTRWTHKLNPKDVDLYLQYITSQKDVKRLLLKKNYRDIVKAIFSRIKFPFFPSKSNIEQALLALKEENQIREKLLRLRATNKSKYHTESLNSLDKRLQEAHDNVSIPTIQFYCEHIADKKILENINSFCDNWQELRDSLTIISITPKDSLYSCLEIVKTLLIDLQTPFLIAPLIVEFQEDQIAEKFFLETNENPDYLEQKFALHAIQEFEKQHYNLHKFKCNTIEEISTKLRSNFNQLLELNRLYIKAKQSNYFHHKIRLSSLSISGLTEKEQKQRKSLMNGVKILEKEFEKSRSLKSIRELNESEAKEIIFTLKPVWLMSPLSISEILPLQISLFDLIIFDEASQIEIEEAIPAIYRAKQCIIVGDKMQMPPSTFFKKEIDKIALIKTHESILHYAEKNLPSIELRWHYRSKKDELILFNNTVFYDKKLQTIPNRKINTKRNSYVEIRSSHEAAFTYEKIRENSLSFHYLKNGVFENRKNEKEANYIAELLKHLLLSKKDLNVGIVALSSEQENAITQAIQQVKYFDKGFDTLLKEKIASQDFFEDLFIKNAENIQGEERDLIIISIGYAYDPQGKFSNNFGPINHQGGERRLNVLFSRAKKNMLLVSSIKYTDIKNSYNRGVNSLKDYLEFTEKITQGEAPSQIAFGEFRDVQNKTTNDSLILSLQNALEEKGYFVEANYGHSDFKIPLAIKKKRGNEKFELAVLIDDESFYRQPPYFSYVGKAEILKEFGWNTYTVICRNWHYEKDNILQEICTRLESKKVKKKEKKEKRFALNAFDYQLSIADLLFTRLETQEEPKKYWQIAGKLSDVVIQYGKLGKKGKTIIKQYENVAEVIRKKRKLIQQKELKGYKRV